MPEGSNWLLIVIFVLLLLLIWWLLRSSRDTGRRGASGTVTTGSDRVAPPALSTGSAGSTLAVPSRVDDLRLGAAPRIFPESVFAPVEDPAAGYVEPAADPEMSGPAWNVEVPAVDLPDGQAPEFPLTAPEVDLPVRAAGASVFDADGPSTDLPEAEAPDLGWGSPAVTVPDAEAPDFAVEAPDFGVEAPDFGVEAPDFGVEAPAAEVPVWAAEVPVVSGADLGVGGAEVDLADGTVAAESVLGADADADADDVDASTTGDDELVAVSLSPAAEDVLEADVARFDTEGGIDVPAVAVDTTDAEMPATDESGDEVAEGTVEDLAATEGTVEDLAATEGTVEDLAATEGTVDLVATEGTVEDLAATEGTVDSVATEGGTLAGRPDLTSEAAGTVDGSWGWFETTPVPGANLEGGGVEGTRHHEHEVVDGGWSVGSAATIADGCMPLGHPIKGVFALGIYQVPGSDWYDATVPDVWFIDEDTAQRAGFTRGEG